ncbi:hypothetical protein Tco_1377790 [Tanacetum coccineum]
MNVSNTLSIGRIEHEAKTMDGCYLVSLISKPSTIWERANVDVVPWNVQSKERVNIRCCVAWTNECEKRWIVVHKVWTSIWRDVRTLAIEEVYTTKYSIHPGADTMLCGFRLTNRWLSMKKDIASCGSKYLAYSEVEVEYQGSSGLLLQPELPE